MFNFLSSFEKNLPSKPLKILRPYKNFWKTIFEIFWIRSSDVQKYSLTMRNETSIKQNGDKYKQTIHMPSYPVLHPQKRTSSRQSIPFTINNPQSPKNCYKKYSSSLFLFSSFLNATFHFDSVLFLISHSCLFEMTKKKLKERNKKAA